MRWWKEELKRGFLFFTQVMIAPFLFVLNRILLRSRTKLLSEVNVRQGTLFISNHQSWADPFIVTYHAALSVNSLRHFYGTVPIRYPTLSEVIRSPLLQFIIPIFGGYDIGQTTMERAAGLLYTRALLQDKHNILLFPEGKCVRDGDVVETFHPGINLLLLEPIPIVLVRLLGVNRWRFFASPFKSQVEVRLQSLSGELPYDEKLSALKSFYA